MMMKRVAMTVVLGTAVLAGCGGGDDEASTASTASAGATTAGCAELADELIVQVQVVVDALSEASLEDLVQDDLLSQDTQLALDDIEERAQQAGCEDDEMDRLLAERADRIEGDGLLAEEVREGLSEGGDLPF